MHIPDGYLSPATCAAMYTASAPFWYVALRRVRKALHTRLVPRLSLFAAFSFVIMMFNLPLPGGTTGHAVGIGLATVVLGPWAAMLAVSIAIVIQALFFGDGGITAIGANCFNMAIAGALVAYAVYRLLAGRAAISSLRRVMAAGLAGYAAINVSALLAAIEFGIQPGLYHTAAGAPLYCPYGLGVAIPAMMMGHLTIAGFAELFVSAGVVAFLQTSDPSLLMATAGRGIAPVESSTRPRSLRPLWLGLAVLMMLTPLGILAAGSAWGEWVASDFANPAARQQIAATTMHAPLPQQTPAGLERLSTVWTAPFARYAPPYVRSASFRLPALGDVRHRPGGAGLRERGQVRAMSARRGFLERTVDGLYEAMEHALYAEQSAGGGGLLQRLDARVKVAGLLALIVASALATRLEVLGCVFALAVMLAVLSRISIGMLATRVWMGALTFTGAIAIPALFLTPGAAVYRRCLVLGWAVTAQGLTTASYLILRVETAATLAMLLVFTTPWTHVLKALRIFRVPVVFVVILGMTCRYILLMLETAHEMFESRKSRTVGALTGPERRRMAVSSAGVLLEPDISTERRSLSGHAGARIPRRGVRAGRIPHDRRAIGRRWLGLPR